MQSDYERVQFLGKGGFGEVHLWMNKITAQKCVVKIPLPDMTHDPKRFERWKAEIRFVEGNNHPNLIKFISISSWFKPGILHYEAEAFGMEYCEGGNIRQVLNMAHNCHGLTEVEVISIFRDIAAAIWYLHSLGNPVIHRDIKPENILISPNKSRNIYKLTDFGFARELASEDSVCVSFVGTKPYLAPEVYHSSRCYSKPADYWSFGICLGEIISGRRPFTHLNLYQIMCDKFSQKSDDEIFSVEDENGIRFVGDIPSPHALNPALLGKMRDFLRLVLRCDPTRRGGAQINGHLEIINLYEEICNTKYFRILDVCTHQIVHYALPPRDQYGDFPEHDMRKRIQDQTGIAISEQNLFFADGSEFTFEKLSSESWSYWKYGDRTLMLFRPDGTDERRSAQTDIEDSVRDITTELTTDHKTIKRLFHAIRSWIEGFNDMYAGFLLSQNRNKHLLEEVERLRDSMSRDVHQLDGMCVGLQDSVDRARTQPVFADRSGATKFPKIITDIQKAVRSAKLKIANASRALRETEEQYRMLISISKYQNYKELKTRFRERNRFCRSLENVKDMLEQKGRVDPVLSQSADNMSDVTVLVQNSGTMYQAMKGSILKSHKRLSDHRSLMTSVMERCEGHRCVLDEQLAKLRRHRQRLDGELFRFTRCARASLSSSGSAAVSRSVSSASNSAEESLHHSISLYYRQRSLEAQSLISSLDCQLESMTSMLSDDDV